MHDLRIPTRKAAAAILLASALPGCAASSLALAPDAPDVPFKTETASGHEQPTQLGVAPGPRDFGLPADANLPLASTSPPIDSTHTYSLAELIDLAQTLHPETRVAWERARQAALGVGIVKALYLPALSAIAVGGGQRDTGSTQAGSLPALSDNGGLHGTVSSLALQWLIFDFGQRDALSQAASEISLASNIAFNGTHQKIIFDVSRAFYEYTSARQRVAIALQSKADSAHVRDAASDRYKQGIGTSVETAQANQLFAQADFDVVQAQGAERDAYHGLLAAVGMSPTAAIKIEDVSRRQLAPASFVPIEHLISEAIARRPDIQASYAAASAASANIKAAEADLLPKVFLTASDTYATGNINLTSLPAIPSLSPAASASPTLSGAVPSTTSIPSTLNNISVNRNDATVLLGVAFPVYDGGVRDAQIDAARSHADAAEATTQRLQQAAATEIVAADDALRSSLAGYRAAGVLVEASTVTEDAALAAYKSGTGTVTASIEAERGLLAARLAQAQTHGTALIAAATLAFSTGRLTSAEAADSGNLGPLR